MMEIDTTTVEPQTSIVRTKQEENNERLFWKVVRNKVIFNHIFYVLETMPIEFDSIEKYYIGNRIKFKNIKNLDWIASHGLWELLKDKIESNQYICITTDMANRFLSICKDTTVLELLFEKKKTQLRQTNIINSCVTSKNEIALNFFLGKLDNDQSLIHTVLPIYQSTLKYAITYSSTTILESLLKHQPILDEDTKKQAYQLASSNSKKSEMIKFILNNPQHFK